MIRQYLASSRFNLPVRRYVTPQQLDAWREARPAMSFREVVAKPLVHSSYEAEQIADITMARASARYEVTQPAALVAADHSELRQCRRLQSQAWFAISRATNYVGICHAT